MQIRMTARLFLKFILSWQISYLHSYANSSSHIEDDQKLHTSRSYVYTLEIIKSKLEDDLNTLDYKINSLVVSYTQSSSLPDDFEQYVLFKIVNSLKSENISLTACLRCINLQAKIVDNELVLQRGIVSEEELEEIVKRYQVSSYTEMNISKLGNRLSLTIVIRDNATKRVIFAKDYSEEIYSIKDNSLIFSLTLSTTTMNNISLLGAEIHLGQRISNFGDIGFWASSKTSKITKVISSVGLFTDFDINDIVEKYWTVGSFLITAALGLSTNHLTTQAVFKPGIKLKIGSLFHLRLESQIYRNLQTKDEIESIHSQNAKIDLNKSLPNTIMAGFGIDLG